MIDETVPASRFHGILWIAVAAVVVVGIGGIGINAVQGAAMAGARRVVAVDPIEFKREKAMEFGATHTFASIEEAQAALGEVTWERLETLRAADAIITTSLVISIGFSVVISSGSIPRIRIIKR